MFFYVSLRVFTYFEFHIFRSKVTKKWNFWNKKLKREIRRGRLYFSRRTSIWTFDLLKEGKIYLPWSNIKWMTCTRFVKCLGTAIQGIQDWFNNTPSVFPSKALSSTTVLVRLLIHFIIYNLANRPGGSCFIDWRARDLNEITRLFDAWVTVVNYKLDVVKRTELPNNPQHSWWRNFHAVKTVKVWKRI